MSWPSVGLLLRVASFSSCAALPLLRAVTSLRSSVRGSAGHDKEDATESTFWNVRRLLKEPSLSRRDRPESVGLQIARCVATRGRVNP